MPNPGNAPVPAAPLQPIAVGSPDEAKKFLYDNAVLGDTPRFLKITRYRAHYECEQYSHQTIDWWGQNADAMETVSHQVETPIGFDTPTVGFNIRQKRPTAPLNLCKTIVDRFSGLIFSDARKPEVVIENDPATSDYLNAVMEQCQFWSQFREARTMGGSDGGVVMTAHIRDGKFAIDTHQINHVTVIWKDRRVFEPAAILVMYRYPVLKIVRNKAGEEQLVEVEYLYRRVITSEEDTLYKPVEVEAGMQLVWEDPADIESQVEHGLGRFPGVWIQNLKKPSSDDGEPDCAGAWQMFDSIDRLLSQMNKGTLVNLDPTLVLGMDPKIAAAEINKGSDHAIVAGQGGTASYLEMTGSGVEAGMKLVVSWKQAALDLTRCVLVDPEKVSGAAQSAKAIELLFEPMIVKADELRGQYGDGIIRLLKIIEELARRFDGAVISIPKVDENGAEILDAAGAQVMEEIELVVDLPPRVMHEELPEDPTAVPVAPKQERRRLGPGGEVKLSWPRYFAPTEADKQTAINTITIAYTSDCLDEVNAVMETCKVFGIRDWRGALARVRKQKTEKMDAAMASLVGDDELRDAKRIVDTDTKAPQLEAPGDEPPLPAAGDGGKA